MQNLILSKEAIIYKPSHPSAQTDRLQEFERRYTIPIALMVSQIYDTLPITDDIYRNTSDYYKGRNLYVIISRSRIKKMEDGLSWDAIVVVIKQVCIIRINVLLNPVTDKFNIKRVYFWSNKTEHYETTQDPETGIINPEVIPGIIEYYNKWEGIN